MDAKLQEVLLDYGLEGYGLYWYCLEMIAGRVSPDKMTFELEHDCRIIARNVSSTPQRVQEMMTRFVEMGLFENADGRVFCMKLAKLADDYTSKLVKKSPPQVIENKAKGQTPTNSENVSLDYKRLEENKVKETKDLVATAPAKQVKSKRFVKPSAQDVQQAMAGKGLSTQESEYQASKFIDYYESNGWKVGKNPMKSWPHAVNNWLRNYTAPVNPGPSSPNMDSTDWAQDVGDML